MTMVIRIGTRASKLARAQTTWVVDRISAHHPGIRVEVITITTQGDRIIDRPLSSFGGKGLFVKEIEEALHRKEIDVAVHSLKDMPAELPETLYLGVIPEREDPYDVLLAKNGLTFKELPAGSSVGTSSLRRAAQLLHARRDLEITPLRGNLDTRIKKLATTDMQAIVVAAAGLNRIGFKERAAHYFPCEILLPAIGQGALGLELRRDDTKTQGILAFLDHDETRLTVEAERSFLAELKAGCQLPVAGFAQLEDGNLLLDGLVANLDGTTIIRDTIEGPAKTAQDLGIALARRLLDAGARTILDEIYGY